MIVDDYDLPPPEEHPFDTLVKILGVPILAFILLLFFMKLLSP